MKSPIQNNGKRSEETFSRPVMKGRGGQKRGGRPSAEKKKKKKKVQNRREHVRGPNSIWGEGSSSRGIFMNVIPASPLRRRGKTQ